MIKNYINKWIHSEPQKNRHGFFHKKSDIIEWLNAQNIVNYKLISHHEYGYVVDVNGDVELNYRNLTSIDVKFNVVNGNFECANNKLTSLKGSPEKVEGSFSCTKNSLTSLEFSPKYIEKRLDCSQNKLTSLQYSPWVGGDYYCNENELISLQGAPAIINGYFDCSFNKLKSLQYVPEIIKGMLISSDNDLENLLYFPKKITATIRFQQNKNLGKWQSEGHFENLYQEHLRQKSLHDLKEKLNQQIVDQEPQKPKIKL